MLRTILSRCRILLSKGSAGRYASNAGGCMVVSVRGGRVQALHAETGCLMSLPLRSLKLCEDSVLTCSDLAWLEQSRAQLRLWRPCWERPEGCPVRLKS